MKLEEYRRLKSKKRTKFGAVACKRDAIRFHSKLERAYYDHLQGLKQTRIVSYFLMQTPLRMPGGVKYLCDFVVFYTDGAVEYVDVKGKATQTYVMKKKIIEDLYPIQIKEVRKGDF